MDIKNELAFFIKNVNEWLWWKEGLGNQIVNLILNYQNLRNKI
jgi:hypothetical protein